MPDRQIACRKEVYPNQYAGIFVIKVCASGHYDSPDEFIDAIKSGDEHIELSDVDIIATEGDITNITEQEQVAEEQERALIAEYRDHERLESHQFTAF